MRIEQIIELRLRGPGSLDRTCIPITGYFRDKTKICEGKSSSGLLFTAKMLQETMHLTSPYPDQTTYN